MHDGLDSPEDADPGVERTSGPEVNQSAEGNSGSSTRPYVVHVEIYETAANEEEPSVRELDEEGLVVSLPYNPDLHRVSPSEPGLGVRDLEKSVQMAREVAAKVLLNEVLSVLPSIDAINRLPERELRDAAAAAVFKYADAPLSELVKEYLDDMETNT